MRRELKIARTQVHDLEAALGLHRKANTAEATVTLAAMTTTNKNAMLEKDLQESRKVIDVQKTEIKKLRSQMREVENGFANRPPSGGRLEPLSVN